MTSLITIFFAVAVFFLSGGLENGPMVLLSIGLFGIVWGALALAGKASASAFGWPDSLSKPVGLINFVAGVIFVYLALFMPDVIDFGV